MNVLKKKGVFRNQTLKRTMHKCGNGHSGVVVRTKGVAFCGTCGKEFR